MIDVLLAAMAVLFFSAGWTAKDYFVRRQLRRLVKARPLRTKPPDEEEQTVLVKRVRASFRNPAQTHTTSYDQYKTRQGLYVPVKPGKGSTADDIEIGGRNRG